ncbi:hypothetical protein D3C77_676580 [compost metagenome]
MVTNDAWETVTNDRQNRASNQRIETIPQGVTQITNILYVCVHVGAAEGCDLFVGHHANVLIK